MKDIKRYVKSEYFWLVVSLWWQVLWAIIIYLNPQNTIAMPMLLVGIAYTFYFIIKGIIYAWVINPIGWYKKQYEKIKSIFR